ncbi:amidohydrolase family protein [Caulobacter segnis]|uniref:amidohydrolase family protein n=1 Tax=Caulobacter segnis TaxID=88688 RepID=UPI00240F756E|nr:amidohydrolase family protein [Caulobacter segnis]MDG2520699.1 amidohydrolase family protein [Caulobacter segnis]
MAHLTRQQLLRAMTALGAVAASPAPALGAAAKAPVRTLIRDVDAVTMDPARGELSGVDVLIDQGRIAAIGKGLNVAGAHVVEASGMVLMPGMADGHRHIWQCVEAGRVVKTNHRQFSAEYQTWKMKWMPCATAQDHEFIAYYGGLQAIDSGVTALIDHAHGHHTADRTLAAARGLKASGVSGWYAHQVSHTIDYGPGDTVPLAHASKQATAFTDASHWEAMRRLRAEVFGGSSDLLNLGMALSVGSQGQPVERVRTEEFEPGRRLGVRLITFHANRIPPYPAGRFGHRGLGIRDLHEAGLLADDVHCSHGVGLSDDELGLMRQTGAMLCATCMAETFPRNAQARRDPAMARGRKAGVRTGIGIDAPLAMTSDFFEHIRASYYAMAQHEESAAIVADYTSADLLDIATRAGYDAINLGGVAGKIAVGQRADLVLLATDRPGFPTAGSLADRIVNYAARSDIDSVWVAGRLRKSGGRMIGVDWKAMNAKLQAIQERIHALARTITFV